MYSYLCLSSIHQYERLPNTLKGTMADDTTKTGADLADEALASVNDPQAQTTGSEDSDEVESSDQLAESLMHLQGIIERNALELQNITNQLKEKRESLKNVFENDVQLAEAKEEAEKLSTQVKERRSTLQNDPQVTSLKAQIGEINEQKKEVEETLNNHLLNYYQMTNSTSFDTSDGDQWEFNVRAKIKSRKG